MEEIILKAEKRTGRGKSTTRKLRRGGKLPAALYGKDIEPVAITIGSKEWEKLQKRMKRNVILDMELYGDGGVEHRSVMVKEVQRDFVKHGVLHVDFLQVSMERMVEVEVPIVLTGTPKGAANNGIVEQHLRTINVECLPGKIPEQIEIDISDLDIGDSFHVNQISLSGIRLLEGQDVAIVTVIPPAVEEAAATAEEVEKKEG